MFSMNDYLKAHLGGFKRDKFIIRVWLFFKSKEYKRRRHSILVRKAIRKAARNFRAIALSESKFMKFVRPEPKLKGAKFPIPKGKMGVT